MKGLNMTRQEAIKKCHGINHPETLVQALEALGIVEFKPEVTTVCQTHGHYMDYGLIKVELWPEGLVLWIGGQIVWKSWTV